MTKKVRLMVLDGACISESSWKEFSVAGILKEMGETLDDYKPESEQSAAAIVVTKRKVFTSIQFFNYDGEFLQFTGLTSDYIQRSK